MFIHLWMRAMCLCLCINTQLCVVVHLIPFIYLRSVRTALPCKSHFKIFTHQYTQWNNKTWTWTHFSLKSKTKNKILNLKSTQTRRKNTQRDRKKNVALIKYIVRFPNHIHNLIILSFYSRSSNRLWCSLTQIAWQR